MKLSDDLKVSDRPLSFESKTISLKELAIFDRSDTPRPASCCPEMPIATYRLSDEISDYCAMQYVRNEIKAEIRQLRGEIAAKEGRVFLLERVVKDTESAMELESRSNEIARALAETAKQDRAAVIAAMLKKQELSK